MDIKKSYSGQAIAIIMVVLVVATVIGASLYSRVIKNREALVEKKESSRALEQADSLLDFLIASSDLLEVEGVLDSCLVEDEGCVWNSIADYKAEFTSVVDTSTLDKVTDWCDADVDEGSSVKITADKATLDNKREIQVGDVMSIKVSSLALAAECNITFNFTKASDSAVFTIKKVYSDDTDVKPYEEDDMVAYCIGPCGTDVVDPIPAINHASEITLPINLLDTSGGLPLYELRIIPLYGIPSVSWQADECASDYLFDYKVNAQVNCKGDYREKEVVLPNVKILGYHPLFDYTIYNAVGVLQPN